MIHRLRHMTLPETTRPARDWRMLAYMLLLIAIGIRITSGLEQHMDILLWDEANYLNRGLWMFDRIPRVWGPAYSAWYKILSFAENDKVALYYLNYRVMTIGVSLLAFIFLAVYGVRTWIAFLISACLLLSAYNLPVWPKISHYCIAIVMASLIAASFTRDLLARCCLFTLGLLVTAYARPELFLAFSLCGLITLFIGVVRFGQSARPVQLLFGFTLIWSAIVCWFYKTPFNSGDSGRSIKVFYQHFSLNYIREHQLDLNWWLDWETIIAQNFKHPESLRSILQYDAPVFFHHIWSNILTFAGKLVLLGGQLLFPGSTNSIALWIPGLVALGLYLLPMRFDGWWPRLRQGLTANRFTLAGLLIFVAPGILVCVYAYPRAHYLVIYLPLLLLLLGLVLGSLRPETGTLRANLALLAGVAMLCLAPKAGGFDFYQLERREASLANVKTIAYLQQLQPADTLRLFDLEGDISSMLSGKYAGYTNTYLRERPVSALDFLDKHHIDIVYVTPPLLQYGSLVRDTAFQRLMNNPELAGFNAVKTGNFGPYLLIRKKH